METQEKQWQDGALHCHSQQGGSLITVQNQDDLNAIFEVIE